MAYKGTHYHGWQIQKNAETVQGKLNHAISLILNEDINITGAGRTDTGVHARYFTAHFDCCQKTLDSSTLINKLNGFLPEDIVIYNIFPVENNSNSRFDAILRTYKYYINRRKDPFINEFSVYLHYPLDIEKMNKGAAVISENNDFKAFSKLHANNKTDICQIKHSYWEETDHMLIYTISADRFLRNMVRAIVGTLLDIGTGRLDIRGLREIFASRDRSMAGTSVPSKGLFLENIEYPENYFGNFN